MIVFLEVHKNSLAKGVKVLIVLNESIVQLNNGHNDDILRQVHKKFKPQNFTLTPYSVNYNNNNVENAKV